MRSSIREELNSGFRFPSAHLAPEALEIGARARHFLQTAQDSGVFVPRCNSWLTAYNADFSRRLAAEGFVGLTIPTTYGGAGLGHLERFAVTLELLAAGAPVASHWIGDRQIAPSLLKFAAENLKFKYLPGIAAGDMYFALGFSEPDAGSDLAAVRTRAIRVDGGWRITGTKVWTSGAHHAHAVLVLARSRTDEPAKQALSEFIVDLPAEGVTVRPIVSLDGHHHFNEVHFDEVFVPETQLVGVEGEGWRQVNADLGFERSGPERIMSTFPLLRAWAQRVDPSLSADQARVLGALLARLGILLEMSASIAATLAVGMPADVEAALVKDLGTVYEGEVVDAVRRVSGVTPVPESGDELERLLADAILQTPSFTLRGGSNEMLRGIISRKMGAK